MRFGLEGKLIDFGRHEQKPAPELIQELIDWFLGDVMDELGTRKEIEYAYRILKEGSSAERQLATFERTGDQFAGYESTCVQGVPILALFDENGQPAAADRTADASDAR